MAAFSPAYPRRCRASVHSLTGLGGRAVGMADNNARRAAGGNQSRAEPIQTNARRKRLPSYPLTLLPTVLIQLRKPDQYFSGLAAIGWPQNSGGVELINHPGGPPVADTQLSLQQ